jgi:hypothetical protein
MVIEPSPKQLNALQSLSPADVAARVVINDDDLEPVATLTTAAAYSSRGAFTDRVRSDNFLRAFVNKTTGATSFQLYQSITYTSEWRNFQSVNFATPSGTQSAPIVKISHRVDCQFGPCVIFDEVGFDVSGDTMRAIANTYVAGNSPLWRFRFKAQNGIDWEDRMAPAEVAGMLLAVESYKAKRATLSR